MIVMTGTIIAHPNRARLAAMLALWCAFVCRAPLAANGQEEIVTPDGPMSWIGPDGAIHLDEIPGQAFVQDPMMPTVMGAPNLVPGNACLPGCPIQSVDCYACNACVVPPHRHSIFGEFLFLHPTGVDMTHAQQQNGTGGAGTTPFGAIGTTDPHYEPAYRFGGNFALSNCSSIAASYTYFESHSVDTVSPPAIPGGGGAVGSLVHHPGASITSSVGPVNAGYDIDFQMADLDYRRLIDGDCRRWINYSAGIRWGRLEQDFRQVGVFSGSAGGVIDTRTQMDFDGFGLKLGLDGEQVIGCRGFRIYGKANVSPLVGRFKSRYLMYNDTIASTLAQANWNDDRFITVLEYEFGLAWVGPRGKWRFSTGYLTSHWFNALTTSAFIDNVQGDNYFRDGDTVSFDGFTARAERRF